MQLNRFGTGTIEQFSSNCQKQRMGMNEYKYNKKMDSTTTVIIILIS